MPLDWLISFDRPITFPTNHRARLRRSQWSCNRDIARATARIFSLQITRLEIPRIRADSRVNRHQRSYMLARACTRHRRIAREAYLSTRRWCLVYSTNERHPAESKTFDFAKKKRCKIRRANLRSSTKSIQREKTSIICLCCHLITTLTDKCFLRLLSAT